MDFTSSFWNYYIIAATVLGLLFCFFLITVVSGKIEKNAKDEPDHVWDGNLSEYNNPLPSWWRTMFALLLVFSIGYLIYYPGLGSFAGMGGWSQTKQYDEEMAALNAKTQPLYDAFAAKSAADLAQDSQAMGMASRLFLNNCAQCHGSDAGGSQGYPSLRKSAGWQWGGSPEKITETIKQGRAGDMAPIELNENDLARVVAYVRSLSGLDHAAQAAAQGKSVYADNCAVCHGDNGKGDPDSTGAPDLTDNVWVYGSSENMIREAVVQGRANSMPAANPAILNDGKIHLLTAYVLSLGNQKK